MRLEVPTGGSDDWDIMRDMFRDCVGKKRQCFLKGQNDAHHVSYKRFRRRIVQRSSGGAAPVVSTPVATGWRCELRFELDTVCQRLELDSPPPRPLDPAQREGVLHGNSHVWPGDVSHCEAVTPPNTPPIVSARGGPTTQNVSQQGWMWRAADTNVLDCSCDGTVALALGSSVYLWSSGSRALVGRLYPSPQTGRARCCELVSSLCWSRDGTALCIGTRRGEVQWFCSRTYPSPRPSGPCTSGGCGRPGGGVCSLQWSPGDDCLASGSTEGLLHIWDGDVAGGPTGLKQPVTTVTQPSAVKAMGWCPWQRKTIATGGGWQDGELRIWDTQSGSCVASAKTNSQICSLRWAEKKRYLVTGHGLPHHQVICWTSEFPSTSLYPVHQLTGHSHRVLHVALNPDSTQIFSAGMDECFHVWDL
ncbi:hypothetical protein INR49_017251 [Caranx melampygus]|nr:hypothetical protein INR49_017251 [Caranx melampygus]